MKQNTRRIDTDLTVIGSGLAGVAASSFALGRNIKTAQAGNTGALAYTTGYFDLLGGLRACGGVSICDPWEGIKTLRKTEPLHPLARIAEDDIRASFEEFITFLDKCGIAYGKPGDRNLDALTPAGTLKKTLSVPATMQAGVDAFSRKAQCTIIDFRGLKGFSSRQIVANLQNDWPQLRAKRIIFPEIEQGEIYPEVLARALEVPDNRAKLAEAVKAVVSDAEAIGMPAIFGIHAPDKVMADLQDRLGIPIFEIPTIPPSVPGIRLREMFEQVFPQKGLTLIPQQKVLSVDLQEKIIKLDLKDNYGPIHINSRTVILATGRFISGGLEAHMEGITEPLLGLPVTQPASRNLWYEKHYMNKEGHEIHRTGIEVDEQFRPLDREGKVVHHGLFGAGILLAHQDWIRGRCGAGIAVATAYKAVQAALSFLQPTTA
ncbi:MAG: glycerol-3-phosphate dehydrogenase subunit GlpB [Desulfofustis sp.]|nr:glycerol-3-phosphate dehydrogenase subunit GlpB [Desulfofustis sp.]